MGRHQKVVFTTPQDAATGRKPPEGKTLEDPPEHRKSVVNNSKSNDVSP
jgi:hypothetical protein